MRPASSHKWPYGHKPLPAPAGRPIRLAETFFLTSLFVLFAFLPLSQTAIAAPSAPQTQNLPNPEVIFAKGLLSVQVEGVRLEALMEEVSKKARIGVSVSESLKEAKVTVQFENVTLEAGLRAIL